MTESFGCSFFAVGQTGHHLPLPLLQPRVVRQRQDGQKGRRGARKLQGLRAVFHHQRQL